jgi:hypothetical protein
MNEVQILEQQAVDAAINLDWKKAIELNKKILKLDKNNVDCHLRLGFIYLQKNDYKEAKKHYKLVIKIQPSNLLAADNLEKIQVLGTTGGKKRNDKDLNFNPNLFIEVPGKTKSISLVNPGQKNILARLTVGEEVYLKPKKRKIELRTKTSEYLGSLPDDISKRLLLFIKAGSEYRAFIKEVSLNKVVIFVREEKLGKKVLKFSSFPKDTQSQMQRIVSEEEHHDETEEVTLEHDLEKLAETLHEEKEFIHYQPRDEEDEENIEE